MSRSFGSATESLQDLRAAVAFFTGRVAEKLREHRLLAGELSVFVHTDRFKDIPQYANSARLSVAPKSDSTLELLPLALKIQPSNSAITSFIWSVVGLGFIAYQIY